MKKLFKNIFLLALIGAVVSIIVSACFPIYWGDDIQISKINNYKQNTTKYNALFFGGSLEYRHISPAILNKDLAKQNIDLKGYNFGVDSHNFIQATNEAEYVVKNFKNDSLKYLFISLSTEAYLATSNLHSNKLICWMNIHSVSQLLKTLTKLKDEALPRAIFAGGYLMSWFENAFNFGKLKDKILYIINKDNINTVAIGEDKDGFVPLELNEHGQVANPETEVGKYVLMISNIMYKNNTSRLDFFNKLIFDTYRDSTKQNKNVDYLYSICDKMIHKYKAQGIKVVFFIPPRVPSGYKQIIPLYKRLPDGNKFNLASPDKYPEFYEVKYGFDNFHMDRSGAEIYSHKMAIELAKILPQSK